MPCLASHILTVPNTPSSTRDPPVIPRVSVLMPVFNAARYLSDALNSISAQSFADIEFVAVDDGSNDGSSRILELFASRERRMKLVTRRNLGLIATRNELLNAARGELVAWMDSDDISLPQRLTRQVDAFDQDPALVCLGAAAQCIDPDGNFLNIERWPLTHREILIDQQKGGGMRFPTTMMRRDLALLVGGFREPFKIGEDLDFLLRLSEHGKMENLPDTLYLYRQHISSICANFGPQWPIYRDQILELARERQRSGKDRLQDGGSLVLPKSANTDPGQNEWRAYLSWAGHALMNDNLPLAWKYACAVVTRRPMSKAAWKMLLRVLLRTGPAAFMRKAR
jgi:glycosyltransferase involved in cell wall biosynthesis